MLSADGKTLQIYTQAEKISDLLAEEGIKLGPADEIWVGGRLVEPDTLLIGAISASREVSNRGGARGETDQAMPAQAAPDEPLLISLRRAATITLDDDGVTTTLHTTLSTVGQVLEANGLSLFLGDDVTPGLQTGISPKLLVTILRSTPVSIHVDGRTIRTRTRAETVAGVLGQEGIALMGKDTVEPALNAAIEPGMTVRVTRVREELKVEFDAIPFDTIWVPDSSVEIDNISLVQQGQIGLTKRRYRVVYENDRETSRVLEDIWTAQSPITKTMAYGTKIVVRTLETPDGPIEYWRKIRAYTVSYKPASCGKAKDDPRYGYTRLGWKLKKGVVATDPSVIPLKTYLYVPGYGPARAGDTGGGVKGVMVDLGYGDDDYQSWHWWTDIYLLTPVPPASQIRWILPKYPSYPDRRR